MKSIDFDRAFDEGEEVLQHFVLERAHRPNLELRRLDVELPVWVIERLDVHAARLGTTRQTLIKMYMEEFLHKADVEN